MVESAWRTLAQRQPRRLHSALLSAFLFCMACGTSESESTQPKQHRAHGEVCDHERGTVETTSFASHVCQDASCTQGENGRCAPPSFGGPTCTYDECFADADCKTGGPCVCALGEFNNRCLLGNCQTDSDCGPNGFCSPAYGSCGGPPAGRPDAEYYCHTPDDECTNGDECDDGICNYDFGLGRWVCGARACFN